MPHARPNPFADAKTGRYVVLWDLNWRVLDCTVVDPGPDLRGGAHPC